MLLGQIALAATNLGQALANKFDLNRLGLIEKCLQIEGDCVFGSCGNLGPELGGQIFDLALETLRGYGQFVQCLKKRIAAIFLQLRNKFMADKISFVATVVICAVGSPLEVAGF